MFNMIDFILDNVFRYTIRTICARHLAETFGNLAHASAVERMFLVLGPGYQNWLFKVKKDQKWPLCGGSPLAETVRMKKEAPKACAVNTLRKVACVAIAEAKITFGVLSWKQAWVILIIPYSTAYIVKTTVMGIGGTKVPPSSGHAPPPSVTWHQMCVQSTKRYHPSPTHPPHPNQSRSIMCVCPSSRNPWIAAVKIYSKVTWTRWWEPLSLPNILIKRLVNAMSPAQNARLL